MKFDYTIKNFRAFDSNGATFTISPITILTGTNSSGKSSVTKSFRALERYLAHVKELSSVRKWSFGGTPMNLSDKEGNLGGFSSVFHKGASYDEGITFQYTVFSKLLCQRCLVTWNFTQEGSDANAWPNTIQIESEDGRLSCSFEEYYYDVENERELHCTKFSRSALRESFFKYISFLRYRAAEVTGKDLSVVKNLTMYSDDEKKHFQDYLTVYGAESFAASYKEFDIDNALLFFKRKTILSYFPILDFDGKLSAQEFRESFSFPKDDELYPKFEIMMDYFEKSGISSLNEFIRSCEDFELNNIPLPLLMPEEGRDFISLLGEGAFFTDKQLSKGISYREVVDVLRVLSARLLRSHTDDESEFPHVSQLFRFFTESVFKEILHPFFTGRLSYVSSSRAVVKRLYSLGDSSSPIESLILKFLTDSRIFPENNKALSFINKWLERFEIGKELVLDEKGEGIGVVPYIRKTPDGELVPLADEGYGVTQFISILLSIGECIIGYFRDNRYKFGYPVYPQTIIIEEPEIHLHPKMQSLLADMFVDAYRQYNIQFIIETHSEYLIRKYQYLVAAHSQNKEYGVGAESISIYYLYDANQALRPEGQQQVQRIEIEEDGVLNRPFGDGFVDLSTDLVLDMFALQNHHE